jgi:hypothetical protein
MQVNTEWRSIVKKAWSFRLMALAGVLTTLEVILPMYSDYIPRGVFAGLTFIVITGGMVARLVAQKDFK